MRKTIHSPESKAFAAELIAMRKARGLTQRQLARRLRRAASVVTRVETADRRLDVIEFYWWCKGLGIRPEAAWKRIMGAIATAQKALPTAKPGRR